jgi:ribosomal protein S19E (S16A)
MKNLSIHKQIEKRIRKLKRGSIIVPGDFSDMGGTEVVKKVLLRLEKQGFLKRAAFGIYVYPKQSKLLGTLTPSVEEIAKAIAKRDKARIVPAGLYALNRLGLSTQMVLNAVYLTDGVARKIRIDGRNILFKKAAPKNLAAKGEISGLVIQALKATGKGKVEPHEEKRILELLQKEKQKNIEHDIALAPAWIRNIMRKAIMHKVK